MEDSETRTTYNEKEERKQWVKEQRAKFKKSPSNFIKTDIIEPTMDFWKKEPKKAISIFLLWVMIYYIGFGIVQAINNDIIYCTSPETEYNGKIMETYNKFVQDYNKEITEKQYTNNPTLTKNYTIFCNYNLTRWWNEPITTRTKTTGKGLWKIVTKQS